MTLYIKTDSVPEGCDYITAGKVYELTKPLRLRSGLVVGGKFTSDSGHLSSVHLYKCAHLNGKPWTLCDSAGNPISDKPEPAAKQCNCSLRTALVGDGCSVCNPDLARDIELDNALDHAEEWKAHAEALAEALESCKHYFDCVDEEGCEMVHNHYANTISALAAFNRAKGDK